MDMLVPRGQPNDTFSESQAVFWNVRSVPESSAADGWKEKRNEGETCSHRYVVRNDNWLDARDGYLLKLG